MTDGLTNQFVESTGKKLMKKIFSKTFFDLLKNNGIRLARTEPTISKIIPLNMPQIIFLVKHIFLKT